VLKDRIKELPGTTIIAVNPLDVLTGNKSPIPVGLEKERVLFNYLYWMYDVNRAYASRPFIISSMQAMEEPVFVKKKGKKLDYDYEAAMQEAYALTHAMYVEDYAKAEQLINAMPVSIYQPKEVLETYRMAIRYAKKEYAEGIRMAEELGRKKGYLQAAEGWLFNYYSAMGDTRAMQYYNKMDPSRQENNSTYYALALIDLAKKDYNAALKNLDMSTSLRNAKMIMSEMLTPFWDLYKAYGDAYTGLKQFNKARDYYNLSLLYYPGYKDTNEALAKMEQAAALEISADKTAPTFVLTEPVPSRGIKVIAAGANFMVKGLATDPSGIKEVLVNGVKMFVQSSGEFWGDVPMKAGLNKLLVLGTDMAGNKGEKSFDVQVTISAAPSNEIIAVNNIKGENYCLLIAAQNYSDTAIPSLNNPISDAIKLKLILKDKYSFFPENIMSLFNPSANDIKRQLLELSAKLKPEDNLLIFYAGHGIWVEKEKKGYWLMTDAVYSNPATWLPNKDVLDLIAKLPSRHTLLITDACFSGSVFKTRSIPANAPANIIALNEKISRIAITSGNDTEVPDESVFMKYLIKALSENKQQYLTAQKMFITDILEAVLKETKTEPRYGTLEMAGHVGGDFIFTKNNY
ncbi:MAG: caspase family protein, partial [Pedobacter sp.]